MAEELKIYADYSICKACGGKCCQSIPGAYHPNDFEQMYQEKLSVDLLLKIFQTSKVAVDYYEQDPRYDIGNPLYGDCTFDEFIQNLKNTPEEALTTCYYLRPKNFEGRNKLEHAAWRGSACINWTIASGCSLPEYERPKECRMLIPSNEGHKYCKSKPEDKGTKKDMAIDWIPYQDIIEKALKIFNSKTS